MEIRYQPDQPIRLNVLGGTSPRTVLAQIVQLSARRAEVRVQEALFQDTAVKIELEDSMLLGEVAACVSAAGSFVALIEIHEAIPSMSDLARLVAAVMNEGRSNDARNQMSPRATVAS